MSTVDRPMLDSVASVERALASYIDCVQPRPSTMHSLGRRSGGGSDRSPFHPSLLADLEERVELRRRMPCLDDDEAVVLVRWYVEGAKPEVIARGLRLSVRQIYRLRKNGIERLVSLGVTDDLADADVSEFIQ